MKKTGLFFLLYFLSCATHGGVYQWTDENGHIHFGSIPPTLQDEYSLGDKFQPAARKNMVPSEGNITQLAEESLHVEKPEQVDDKPVEHEIPAVQEALVQKTDPVPVREDELQVLITRLRYDAGEIVSSDDEKKSDIQKAEVEFQPAEKSVVETPVIVSESNPEAGDSVVPAEKQDLLKEEATNSLIVEAVKIASNQQTEADVDEDPVVPKKPEETKVQKPVVVEVLQPAPVKTTKVNVVESQPNLKNLAEEKVKNSLLAEESQSVLDQKPKVNIVESQPVQKDLVEAEVESLLLVDESQSVSDQKTEEYEEEGQLAQEGVPEGEKDLDKCGLFMGFVEQYEIKKSEGCPGSHCDVYKRQLRKFKQKQKRYC